MQGAAIECRRFSLAQNLAGSDIEQNRGAANAGLAGRIHQQVETDRRIKHAQHGERPVSGRHRGGRQVGNAGFEQQGIECSASLDLDLERCEARGRRQLASQFGTDPAVVTVEHDAGGIHQPVNAGDRIDNAHRRILDIRLAQPTQRATGTGRILQKLKQGGTVIAAACRLASCCGHSRDTAQADADSPVSAADDRYRAASDADRDRLDASEEKTLDRKPGLQARRPGDHFAMALGDGDVACQNHQRPGVGIEARLKLSQRDEIALKRLRQHFLGIIAQEIQLDRPVREPHQQRANRENRQRQQDGNSLQSIDQAETQ